MRDYTLPENSDDKPILEEAISGVVDEVLAQLDDLDPTALESFAVRMETGMEGILSGFFVRKLGPEDTRELREGLVREALRDAITAAGVQELSEMTSAPPTARSISTGKVEDVIDDLLRRYHIFEHRDA